MAHNFKPFKALSKLIPINVIKLFRLETLFLYSVFSKTTSLNELAVILQQILQLLATIPIILNESLKFQANPKFKPYSSFNLFSVPIRFWNIGKCYLFILCVVTVLHICFIFKSYKNLTNAIEIANDVAIGIAIYEGLVAVYTLEKFAQEFVLVSNEINLKSYTIKNPSKYIFSTLQ